MLRQRIAMSAVVFGAILLFSSPAAAQLLSNASLKGAYNVRYLGSNTGGTTDVAVSFSGTMTFDGNGGYTVTGQGITKSATTLKYLTSGQYAVKSSGMLLITNPFDPTSGTTFDAANTVLYGGLSGAGVVTASSTDTDYCDLFVAVPAATSASNSTLSGNYYVASMEFPGGDFTLSRDTMFPVTANNGSLGNVTVSGTAINLSNAVTTQTSSGATYSLSANGTGTMTFPAPSGVAAASQLLSGSKVLYVSQDGSFFVAGGASSYDMILGVKALASAPSLSGLYFTAELENVAIGSQSDGLWGMQGASNFASGGVEIGHQRTAPEGYYSFDFTYASTLKPGADGTVQYPKDLYPTQWAVGAGGNFIIASGMGGNYQLAIYVKVPSLGGTGVFLHPQYVVNAANYAPFTAGVSPGEVILLVGSGLAGSTTTASGPPFPTTMSGVQVGISWVDSSGTSQTAQAPIYRVSPTQIAAVVPYTVPSDGTFLNFTVTNNGSASNAATVYSIPTSPGIWTWNQDGISDATIEHADYSFVNSASPAKPGETVQIFLTGLGAVSPAVTAGAAGPSSTLSKVTSVPDVYIDNQLATVTFAGLTPTAGALYQLNVTIPSNVTKGADVTIEIVTDDADNIMAMIPISK